MKTYSIGRDLGCDIVINDTTDIVSRRHALLNVASSGKMTIIDQSSNGTYVNGIKISKNVPVPVTRKDTISFAHIAKLNWNLVPKSDGWKNVLIAFIALLFVAVFGGAIYYFLHKDSKPEPNQQITIPEQKTDSIGIAVQKDTASKQTSVDQGKKDSESDVDGKDNTDSKIYGEKKEKQDNGKKGKQDKKQNKDDNVSKGTDSSDKDKDNKQGKKQSRTVGF